LSLIHPSAIVDAKADLGKGVSVGPFAIVEGGAILGADCKVESHAVVRGNVTMGERNVIGHGAIIGGDPQDRKYKNEQTYLRIGNDNTFREFVTLHRATGEGKATVVGNGNFLMAFTHVGHNCTIQNNVTIANSCGISGHVTIEDGVNIGGMTGVHQFVRIGKYCMIGAMSGVGQDVPPFMLTEGRRCRVYDINAVGLRRLGIGPEVRMALHRACKILYRSDLSMGAALDRVRSEVEQFPEVKYLVAFLDNMSEGRFGRQDQR
jgi:UDP-N-acetylglucosamine acyltransferase